MVFVLDIAGSSGALPDIFLLWAGGGAAGKQHFFERAIGLLYVSTVVCVLYKQ
jgi:hypothetical protein